jgi:hypothetical protein
MAKSAVSASFRRVGAALNGFQTRPAMMMWRRRTRTLAHPLTLATPASTRTSVLLITTRHAFASLRQKCRMRRTERQPTVI